MSRSKTQIASGIFSGAPASSAISAGRKLA
jgi:hypothetical protein